MTSKHSEYNSETYMPIGKVHFGKKLKVIPISYWKWYRRQNIDWWNYYRFMRDEIIIRDPPSKHKYLLMEYIENNIDLS